LNRQKLIEKVANMYFGHRSIIPSDDYKIAVQRTIEAIGFYTGGETNCTAVIPLETGGGKTTIVKLLMPELYVFDKTKSGTIILLPYKNECDKLARDINNIGNREIAVAYHSKNRISKKEMKKYPILIMTHNRFLSGTEELATYSVWSDMENLHGISNEPVQHRRERLIIDESINKISLLPISTDTLTMLDNFFQEQKNTADFELWQGVCNKIRAMFVMPILPEKINKTIPVKLDESIPKRLIEVINTKCSTLSNEKTKKAFKAVINLAVDGGMLKTASNPAYRKIQTACYINIFNPLFTSVVLDGTARINKTYQNEKYFEVIDIPKTKKYEKVTIHIEPKTSGSRSAIDKDDTLITRTIEYINDNLINRNILLICHKDFIDRFNCFSENENVSVAHWGSFNGSNKFNNKNCIVYCGAPYVDESYYIYLYHIFSGDKDYNKNQTCRPGGKTDPVMRFHDEALYEEMRQSYLAVEFVQSINRGICRNYSNTIPMHVFLPYRDRETLDIIKDELTGIKIKQDYKLLTDIHTAPREEPKKDLEDVVVEVLLNRNKYFGNESIINKSAIFDVDDIKGKFKCSAKKTQSDIWKSSQILELQNIGILSLGHRHINFLNKSDKAV
jgi:hypothetical protein